MKYSKVHKAKFLSRPNRFIAYVNLNGNEEKVHVKNTGRCKELLLPGSTVYLEESSNPARKTKYDLIAVEKVLPSGKILLINMDSQVPNKVAAEWILENKILFPKITFFKPEYSLADSRFDFYLEYEDKKGLSHKMLIEVKGCTLEKDGLALFPDAPTLRGLKHVKELTHYQKSGLYECMLLIIVQMEGCKYFTPNYQTHEDFGLALKEAKKAGVKIIAEECKITPDSIKYIEDIEVRV